MKSWNACASSDLWFCFQNTLRPLSCEGSDRTAVLDTTESEPWSLCFEARGFLWAREESRWVTMVSEIQRASISLCSRRVWGEMVTQSRMRRVCSYVCMYVQYPTLSPIHPPPASTIEPSNSAGELQYLGYLFSSIWLIIPRSIFGMPALRFDYSCTSAWHTEY